MAIKFSNNAITTTTGDLLVGDTSIPVTDGSVFATLVAGDYQVATLTDSDKTVFEVIHITANAANTLTVLRGMEGTTAVEWLTGSTLFAGTTAGVLDTIKPSVLTEISYFSPDGNPANADYKYVSIGDGSGTDGADFIDIYAFVDFINNSVTEGASSVFGYFKNAGVVTLSRDLFINHRGFGNVFIYGAGATTSMDNFTWGDPITTTVTAFNDTAMTVTVADSTGMFVGGVLAVYPATSGLANPKNSLRLYTITGITGNTLNIQFNAKYEGVGTVTSATGIVADAVFNRTVITGGKTIYVGGLLGNPNYDGGFSNIAFNQCQVVLSTKYSQVILNNNVHFVSCGLTMSPDGFVETWGDVFTDGLTIKGGVFIATTPVYLFPTNAPSFNGASTTMFLQGLISTAAVDFDTKVQMFSNVGVALPDLGDLTYPLTVTVPEGCRFVQKDVGGVF